VFVYWTVNNIFLLGQHLLFENVRCRNFLGILPRPPKKPSKKVARPGVWGFMLDRWDFIKLAFKNYMDEAAERRNKINRIGKDKDGVKDVKYETKSKGPADKRARRAGMVEKLK
jgi:hypothetical protein